MKNLLKGILNKWILNSILLMIFSFFFSTTHSNVPLHEWTSQLEVDESRNLTTWIFEDGTFIPSHSYRKAKLKGDKAYSIITDHLGTPIESYDEEGEKVWSRELGIYGQTRKEIGEENFIPFLYQGQYLDTETDLAYNRFRYYSPESGSYISQDRIRLTGGSRFYEYSRDVNLILDPFGLADFYHATNGASSTNAVMGGIDPSKGRPNLDFNPSGQGGFYVTNDLAQAQSWADRKGGDVIHFDVPDDELAELNIKTFDSATDEWADTVKSGRRGTLNHAYDGMDGPMLANPRRGKPKPIGHQLAIFTDKAAKLFDKHNKGKLPSCK